MNTIKLVEAIQNNLNESEREDKLLEIKFIKKLLDRGMNEDNYDDKTERQLEIILNKYKDEFNNSNIDKYVAVLVIYNKNTNSGKAGFLADSNEIVERRRNALVFDNKEDAKIAIDNYKVPENYELINNDIHKIKF